MSDPVRGCWKRLASLSGGASKNPLGFLERTQNEKRRFRFVSKSKPYSFDGGWHFHVSMATSKNQGFLEMPQVVEKALLVSSKQKSCQHRSLAKKETWLKKEPG
jgi:hypothetical protein